MDLGLAVTVAHQINVIIGASKRQVDVRGVAAAGGVIAGLAGEGTVAGEGDEPDLGPPITRIRACVRTAADRRVGLFQDPANVEPGSDCGRKTQHRFPVFSPVAGRD